MPTGSDGRSGGDGKPRDDTLAPFLSELDGLGENDDLVRIDGSGPTGEQDAAPLPVADLPLGDISAARPDPTPHAERLEMEAPAAPDPAAEPAQAAAPLVVPPTGSVPERVLEAPAHDPRFGPSGDAGSIELDFDAAKSQPRPPLAGPASASASASASAPPSLSPSLSPSASGSTPTSAIGRSQPTWMQPAPSESAGSEGRRGILFEDAVASRLVSLAIGMALGLLPAIMTSRQLVRNDVEPRLFELEDVVDRPLAVRAGKARTPEEVAGEIHRASSKVSSRFYMMWVGFGLPLGLILSFARKG